MTPNSFVVRLANRQLYLRKADGYDFEDEDSDGKGCEMPGEFLLDDVSSADRFSSAEDAAAFLAEFKASGQLTLAAAHCIVEELR